MFMWDPTMILIIPALILAIYAQFRVKGTYSKYSQIYNNRHMTGYQAAVELLRMNGIGDVEVEETEGTLSDHYNPRVKKVRLSQANFRGASLSSLAVAAHEVGHAVQHHKGYVPLQLRHAILPVTNFGSWLAFPLFFIGFLMRTPFLMDLGIVLFGGVVVFHLVTLPVEFNASNRALLQLESHGFLTTQEVGGAKKVLNAAALTYVAATAMALMQLVRLLLIRNRD
ncbi:MAG: peptidase [Caldithrix sp. RBG_13_44_9]|nr:MAG: peptidase [Caldithrix sp. RBG_13_44_9]